MFRHCRLSAEFPILAFLLTLLAACNTLPPLEQTRAASPDQVAVRVQCELAKALEPHLTNGRRQNATDHTWLQKWTAEVDLTLVVADTTGVAPTVLINNPIKPAVLPGIGSFAQAFTFGVNAGLNSTATRTEQLSFTIDLKNLPEHARSLPCSKEENRDLDANLGMSEWLDDVFKVIDSKHVNSGAAKPKPLRPATIPRPATAAPSTLAVSETSPAGRLESAINSAYPKDHNKDPLPVCDLTLPNGNPIPVPGGTALKPDAAMDVFRCFTLKFNAPDDISFPRERPKEWRQDAEKWLRLTKNIIATVRQLHESQLTKEQAKRENYENFTIDKDDVVADSLFLPKDSKLSTIATYYRALMATAITIEAALRPKALPPVQAIVHQVNFVLVANTSVSPNWSLVRVKGPNNSASTNLVSASRSRTHGLVITIGDPGSDAAKTARASASISSALKNSGIIISP
jgi:hypothetical protein